MSRFGIQTERRDNVVWLRFEPNSDPPFPSFPGANGLRALGQIVDDKDAVPNVLQEARAA
jgi:hypothetical protein